MVRSAIPRIIHQIWIGPRQPPCRLMQSVQRVHADWEYRLWNEQNLPPMRRRDAFERSPTYDQKADVLRYEILWQYGGVYVDADSLALRPIDALLDGVEMFAGYEGNPERPDLIATGVLGCAPRHANMDRLIEDLDVDLPGAAWEIVGPGYFTASVARHRMRMTLYPARYFYPFHYSNRRSLYGRLSAADPRLADSYLVQYWGTTTHRYDPFLQRIRWRLRFELQELRRRWCRP